MLDIKQTKWVIFDKNLKNIYSKGYWIPIEKLATLANGKSIQYYRGYKAAINGYLSSCVSTSDIENNEIRVLPINLTISIDDTYQEVPVSDYFKPKYVDINHIGRFIKTKRLNLVIDLMNNPSIHLFTHHQGGDVYVVATWKEKDKYGVSRDYSDDVIATSNNIEDLK